MHTSVPCRPAASPHLQAGAALILLVPRRILRLAAHVAPRALHHYQPGRQVDAQRQRAGGAQHLRRDEAGVGPGGERAAEMTAA